MRKIFTLITIIFLFFEVRAQLHVQANGEVRINAQTQDYFPALRVTVPTQYSCSYNLWNTYYNQDVFYVRGDGVIWSRLGYVNFSDKKYKTNISLIEQPLQKICKLRGVRYQFKDDTVQEAKYRIGFIAQEVDSVCPEFVITDHNGNMAVFYSDITALLVEAIKEQQKQITQLQADNEEQKHQIRELQNKIQKK